MPVNINYHYKKEDTISKHISNKLLKESSTRDMIDQSLIEQDSSCNYHCVNLIHSEFHSHTNNVEDKVVHDGFKSVLDMLENSRLQTHECNDTTEDLHQFDDVDPENIDPIIYIQCMACDY